MILSIIIPVFNNAGTLEELADGLRESAIQVSENYEIIFIDDGSTDDSVRTLQKISANNPLVSALVLTRNFGQHAALSAGLDFSSGDVVVFMDADLQERPDSIPYLVRSLQEHNADVAFTRRVDGAERYKNRKSSDLFLRVFSRVVGQKIPSGIGTQRAFSKKVLSALREYREVNVIYGPLMNSMGFRSVVVDVPHFPRREGSSGYTFFSRVMLAFDSLVSFTDLPHKLATGFGILVFLLSALYGLIVLFQYFLFGSSFPDGTTLIILMIVFFGGIVTMILGVNGLYLARVYSQVLERPRYHVSENFGPLARMNPGAAMKGNRP